MEIQQPKKEYVPSIPYLIFLREAIKGGYKPTLEEKEILKKYSAKAVRNRPQSGFVVTEKGAKKVVVSQHG